MEQELPPLVRNNEPVSKTPFLVFIGVMLIVIIAGIVTSDYLKTKADEKAPAEKVAVETEEKASEKKEEEAAEPAPGREIETTSRGNAPQRNAIEFTMPKLIGLDSSAAAEMILKEAPGATIQVIGPSGRLQPLSSHAIVTSSQPTSGMKAFSDIPIILYVN